MSSTIDLLTNGFLPLAAAVVLLKPPDFSPTAVELSQRVFSNPAAVDGSGIVWSPPRDYVQLSPRHLIVFDKHLFR